MSCTAATRPYIRRRSRENSYWCLGNLTSVLAATADTDGVLAVLESTLRPGLELPAHVHAREEEAVFVLDGHLDGWAGETAIAAGPGEMVVFPRDVPHAYQVRPGADGTARALTILVPGALQEFFLNYARPAPALALPDSDRPALREADQARIQADAAAFGIAWMPPASSLAVRRAPSSSSCLALWGERFRPLALSGQTLGAFTALLWTSPAQSRLPRHLHHDADEAFYVLDGAVEFATDRWSAVGYPGDFVFLPQGVAHRHRAAAGRSSCALQLLAPGGIEEALAEIAALPPASVTLERLAAIAERYGLTLLPE